ncbi:MAG TPA: folylpolyglutamate synthase/dihydrofolate synthase family protein [Bacteroidales bacterium]|nr:folylpolyglutamate synthase/dihydrofolate synthase family protein [Bacteroidales bacterium]
MNYNETLGYLHSRLPMFHRIGPAAYKANLDNSLALSHYLGKPETNFRSIHIAGTNGKGSVSNMIASVLQQQGYKTGLATSPHLKDFRERIRINGKMIPKHEVSDFVSKHRQFIDRIQPSFFELTIALTFDFFACEKVDVAVIETGLGGRLDSTNIIKPEVSVITNIGMDHMNLLGDTLEKIAGEKAGIIKASTPVVIGRSQPEIFHVFERKANELNAPIYKANDLFKPESARYFENAGRPFQEMQFSRSNGSMFTLQTDLLGKYQLENMASVLATFEILSQSGHFAVSELSILEGLSKVNLNTGFKGRWFQLGKCPSIICDTGHNADGIRMVVSQLKQIKFKSLRMVFGMVDDKDIEGILSLLPSDAVYYFCKPNVPRGLDQNILASEAARFALHGRVFESVKKAFVRAKKEAAQDDLILVGGSTFVVAEVLK